MSSPVLITPSPDARAAGLRLLTGLLVVAVSVSIVHYVDNVANYADYPDPGSGPSPSRALVAFSWFFFTAFGLAGYVMFRRARIEPAAVSLAVYSGSGLVGLGHYTVPGAFEMPWWRQLHVILDIGLGIAIFAFAVWAWRRHRTDRAVGEARVAR